MSTNQNLNFTAIDFETAIGPRYSICQVGLVVVENGIITNTYNQLIQPPNNEYSFWNIRVHGIYPEHTENAPLFPDIWNELEPLVQNQLLIAHNAPFDRSCLIKTLEYYHLPVPVFQFECTYKATKMKLNDACNAYNVVLQKHHDALSDALACAGLYMKIQQGIEPGAIPAKSTHPPRSEKITSNLRQPDLSQASPSHPFYNKKMVFTGVLKSMGRTEAAQKARHHGAIIRMSINPSTRIIVMGDRPGPAKLSLTRQLIQQGYPITILNEDTFLHMLQV